MTRAPIAPAAPDPVVDVLIVENDPETLEMFVDVVRANQFSVRGAANVVEAEAAMRERVPDVVLCDLHLGRVDSAWRLVERMRQDPRTHHAAWIAMTGRVSPTLEMMRAFDEYLRKPLNLSLLFEVLRRLGSASRKASRRAA